MAKVSILIPACNERFLKQTVDGLFAQADGEIEVIVALDGPDQQWPLPVERPGLHLVHYLKRLGMRAMINAAAQMATGEYLLKTDAHCLFGPGYDKILATHCDEHWIVIPSRYSLDAENWQINVTGKARIDYHYLSSPVGGLLNRGDFSMHGVEWRDRARRRRDKPEYEIDEQMSYQGSAWFMSRRHWDWLGGYSETGYGTFTNEAQELGNKTWLGLEDGRVMTNKLTWYAHLHKGHQYGRMYSQSQSEIRRGQRYCADYWLHNRWDRRIRDLDWLIDRFWPVPDWPGNWQQMRAEGFGPETFKFVPKVEAPV